MMQAEAIGEVSWTRMIRAVEKVRERLLRATRALNNAHISYAVIGGNAVAAFVSKVDESVVRSTQDVDLLICRADLPAVKACLEKAGFHHCDIAGRDVFLDGPHAQSRDVLHIVYAGEKVRPEYYEAAPSIDQSESAGAFRILNLSDLVRMKLTSFRDKDRTHLRDLLEVGLIDASWCANFPKILGARLKQLIDNPDG